MADINNFTFTGNLTKDAEQRFTSSGTAVLSFDVANNTGFGDKQKTSYFKCAIFGKRAEGKLAEYLTKGTKVAITGEVSQDCREHNGKTYCDLKVFVNNLALVGGQSGQASNQREAKAAPDGRPSNVFEDFDDMAPF